MKLTSALIPTLLATPALAHTGHVAENSGHDHIVAVVAIGTALCVALWSVIRVQAKARNA